MMKNGKKEKRKLKKKEFSFFSKKTEERKNKVGKTTKKNKMYLMSFEGLS